MAKHRIGVIGLGKIAQDQHLPVIAKSAAFELAAVSSQRGLTAGDALAFRDHEELLAKTPDLDAVAVCTPPQARHADRARGARSRQARDAGEAADGDALGARRPGAARRARRAWC